MAKTKAVIPESERKRRCPESKAIGVEIPDISSFVGNSGMTSIEWSLVDSSPDKPGSE